MGIVLYEKPLGQRIQVVQKRTGNGLAVLVSVENDAQRLSVIERLLQVFQEALLIAVRNAAAYFSVESQIVQSGNITYTSVICSAEDTCVCYAVLTSF